MNFLNLDKLERAQKVVKDPSKLELESVERVALGRVDVKLSDEEKVVEVYKILGGVIGPDDTDTEEEQEKPKKKKSKHSA